MMVTLQTISNLFQTHYMLKTYTDLELLDFKIYSKLDILLQEGQSQDLRSGISKVYLNVYVGINIQRFDVWGHGINALSSIVSAAKALGFEIDLLNHQMHAIEDNVANVSSQRASFAKVSSKTGSIAWGVAIHEDQVWALMQAVSFFLVTIITAPADEYTGSQCHKKTILK